MKYLLFLLFNLVSIISFSQQDTIRKTKTILPNQKEVALRIGVGIEKSFYTDIGVSIYFHPNIQEDPDQVSVWHGAFYATVTNHFKKIDNRSINGFRLGAEASTLLFYEAIEFTYYWNEVLQKKDLIMTPKLGFTALGILNIHYGYNISFNKRTLKDVIGRHQISMTSNIGHLMFKKNNQNRPK